MSNSNTFSISFYQRVDKIDKSGEAPIYMRITINGERAEIAVNRRFDAKRWESGRLIGAKNDAKLLQKYLDSLKTKVYDIQREMIDRKELVTASNIKNRYNGKNERSKNLIEIFEHHNNQIKGLVGKDYSLATSKKYDTTLSHIKEFMKYQYKSDNIYLSEIKYEFVTNLEYFLKTVHNCNHNSTMKYIKNFRKVINLAIKNEWLDKDPFIKFNCKINPVERHFLTAEELTEFENKKIVIPRMDQVRDVFVFCCYTGLAYIDVSKLSSDNIVIGIDGLKWINVNRTKTGTKSQFPLLPKAMEIINKYNNGVINLKGSILPVISNQKMNAYLKELADICGITKNLTFHIARHTFATTVALTNNLPIETVGAVLGHQNLRSTQIYAKVVPRKISNDMAVLRDKLSRNDIETKAAM